LIDKEADLGALTTLIEGSNFAFNLYNNLLNRVFDTYIKENNSTEIISIIIRNIPLTSIEAIQSLVLYCRTDAFNNTTIGVAIELYNSTDDPDLNTILTNTEVIATAVNVYRFVFHSIDTYTCSFVSADSTTQIAINTYATTQILSKKSSPIQMIGIVVVSGNFTLDGGNVGATLADIIACLVGLKTT
jgi:hypothetical protein